jgi:hypothetical protein
MGCCGNRYKIKTPLRSIVAPQIVSLPAVNFSASAARARTAVAGDICVYCKGTIAEKVKLVNASWHRVPWCPKCRLEV